MKQEYRIRQADIIKESILQQRINIVGVGAVGSHLTYMLARMGFTNITVFDFDNVDKVNISSQGFSIADIGKPKVQAVAERVLHDTGVHIEPINRAWTPDDILSGVTVCAADSMKVRRDMWKTVKPKLFIDTRMGAENMQIFVLSTNSDEFYNHKHTLYSDEEAVQVPCTAKATIYTASIIGGIVANAIKNFLQDMPYCSYMSWNIGKNCMDAYEVANGES